MLEAMKRYLKITWNDEDEDILSIIDRAKAKLNDLVGAELDYEAEGPARSLLFDYCRYIYNNAAEYFEENFKHEIVRLQLKVGISTMEDDADAEN